MPHNSPTAVESLAAGSVAGMAGILSCHPLDVIRTKMQISSASLTRAVQITYQEGGAVGFFKGIGVPFAAQAVYKSVIFGANTMSQKHIFHGQISVMNTFLSGLIAGTINGAIVAPVEAIRTTQILAKQTGSGATTIGKAVASIVANRGILGFWYTFPPTILRDGPGMGFYMLAFDVAKRALMNWTSDDTVKSVPIWIKMTAGSMAGIAFWTWAMPIDTVKTVIESTLVNKTSLKESIKGLNWTQLYRALPVAYLRGIPSAAVTLTIYDTAISWMLIHDGQM